MFTINYLTSNIATNFQPAPAVITVNPALPEAIFTPTPNFQTIQGAVTLTLFDPATVGERNDYLDPSTRPAGIDIVWVHGHCVLDHGALFAPRPFPGRTLLSPLRA